MVVEDRSGRALARSNVSLVTVQGGRQVPQSNTLSDAAGRFRFADLPAGVYFVSARREGLLAAHYGGGGGAPVVLESHTRFTVELRLQRAGALSGEVLDENLVGLPGSEVLALRQTRTGLEPAGSARSDDRGIFRIPGLAPGTYLVRTSPRRLEDGRELLPTYLGQTADGGAARPVRVLAEAEQHAGAVQPIPGRLGRVRGAIPGGAGAAVTLYSDAGARTAAASAAGAFEFGEIAPAEYELLATAPDGRAAWTRLRAADEDTQADLTLAPAPVVRARVSGGRAHFVLTLARLGLSRNRLPNLTVGAGAAVPGVPGEYRVTADTTEDFCLIAVEPQSVRLKPGEETVVSVTVSDRPARLRGRVTLSGGQPAAGAPVLVRAEDDRLHSLLGGARQTRAGDDGSWTLGGLPPGKYLLSSTLSPPDPDAPPAGRAVTLAAGDAVEVDLVLTP